MVKANLEQWRAVRSQTAAMMENLSQEQLDFFPELDEWSIGEILGHLILSDEFIHGEITALITLATSGQDPYLYRSCREFNARPAFVPESALSLLEAPLSIMTMFMPESLRDLMVRRPPLAAEAADATTPRRGVSRSELHALLRDSMADVESLLEAHADLDYARMRHHHPMFGIQTVPQLLRSIWLHEQAHQDQIQRVARHPNFPASVTYERLNVDVEV